MQVRLHEAPDNEHDPLAHLRPSSPPPAGPRFDVVIGDAGEHRTELVNAMFEAFGREDWDSREQLLKLPCTVARSFAAPRAEAVAGILRRAGATVDLERNDG